MLEIKNIHKTYYLKKAPPTHALVDVNLKFENKGMVFILGKSGSGKSTFLNVVGGLDKFDSGEIIIKGKSSSEFTGSDFDSYRNTYLGFIFQEYNIIEEFTIGDNIALALQLQHKKASKEDVERILEKVDMQGYSNRFPNQISGGQRQRVAIARALIKEPEIIFADEPTGALDSATGEQIFQTLKKLSKEKLVIIVSHDREYAEIYGDRIIEFKDGKIISDMIKLEEGFNEQITVDGAIVANDVVKIPKNSSLTEAQTSLINEMLKSGELIISTNQNLNRYFADQFNSEKKKGSFEVTTEEKLNLNANSTPFKLIKSRLPASNAQKMARSSMKHKRGRLVFSIILSIFAVMFFGFSNVMGGFNERNVVGNVLRDYDYEYMTISRKIKKDEIVNATTVPIAFESEDLERLSNMTDGGVAKFLNNDFSMPTYLDNPQAEYNHLYFTRNFSGIVYGDLAKLNLPLPEVYGRLPLAKDEILISNYSAQHFLAKGMYYVDIDPSMTDKYLKASDIENVTDILSYYIPIDSGYGTAVPLKIVGIINFNIERYKDIMLNETLSNVNSSLYNEFNERKNHEISYIYGTEGLSDLFYNYPYSYSLVDYNLEEIYAKSGWQVSIGATSYQGFLQDSYSSRVIYKDPSFSGEPNQNQVLINLNVYNGLKSIANGGYDYSYEVYSQEKMEQIIEESGLFRDDFKLNARFMLGAVGYEIGNATNLDIVGVVSTASYGYNNPLAIFNNNQYEQLTQLDKEEYYFVYLKNDSVINDVVKNFVGDFKISGDLYNSYDYRLPFANMIFMIDIMFGLMSMIFVVLGIAFCVFSALLLLNFISTSVAYKKKEIGILRAIGARKSDVISIFLWEGFFIGLWIICFAVTLVFALVVIFNNFMSSFASVPFSLLTLGLLDILIMVLISFATIAIASILPVSRITSKNPIDAIRG